MCQLQKCFGVFEEKLVSFIHNKDFAWQQFKIKFVMMFYLIDPAHDCPVLIKSSLIFFHQMFITVKKVDHCGKFC